MGIRSSGLVPGSQQGWSAQQCKDPRLFRIRSRLVMAGDPAAGRLRARRFLLAPPLRAGLFLGRVTIFVAVGSGLGSFNLFGDIVESARSGVAHEGIPIACDLARV